MNLYCDPKIKLMNGTFELLTLVFLINQYLKCNMIAMQKPLNTRQSFNKKNALNNSKLNCYCLNDF